MRVLAVACGSCPECFRSAAAVEALTAALTVAVAVAVAVAVTVAVAAAEAVAASPSQLSPSTDHPFHTAPFRIHTTPCTR